MALNDVTFGGETLPIFINRRNVMRFHQQRSEWLPLPFAAADRERTQCYAVVALSRRRFGCKQYGWSETEDNEDVS